MTRLLDIAAKIAWWLAPKVLGRIVDAFGQTLVLVQTAETGFPDKDLRRDYVLLRMPGAGVIPEWAARALIEFCVILHGLGVTPEALDKMEELVSNHEADWLSSTEKRTMVLERFAATFPDLPERIGRLLLEIAVAKIRAGFKPAPTSAPTPTDGTAD